MLNQQGIIKTIKVGEDIEGLKLVDIVEFGGAVSGSPTFQIRHAFAQPLPVLIAYNKMNEAQYEQEITQLQNAKLGSTLTIMGEEVTIQNKSQSSSLQALIQSQQQIKKPDRAGFEKWWG